MTMAISHPISPPADKLAHSGSQQSPARWYYAIIQQEGPAIVRMLWRMLGKSEDVQDAFQDCFCKLATVEKDPGATFTRAYVYRTACNVAIDIIRQRQRTAKLRKPLQDDDEPESTIQHEASSTTQGHNGSIPLLHESIARLPEHLRQVIILRDLGGLAYEVVGKLLNIEPTTARVYRRHAVVQLAEMMSTKESATS